MVDMNAQGQLTVMLAALKILIELHPGGGVVPQLLDQQVERLIAITLATRADENFFQGVEHAKAVLIAQT